MVTNLKIQIPTCLSFKGKSYYEDGSRVYASAPMGGVGGFINEVDRAPQADISPIVTVRTFFPETWLFKLFETG